MPGILGHEYYIISAEEQKRAPVRDHSDTFAPSKNFAAITHVGEIEKCEGDYAPRDLHHRAALASGVCHNSYQQTPHRTSLGDPIYNPYL